MSHELECLPPFKPLVKRLLLRLILKGFAENDGKRRRLAKENMSPGKGARVLINHWAKAGPDPGSSLPLQT